MDEVAIKREKKATKIFKNTALMGGVGFGLFILSLIAPLIHSAESTGAMQGIFIKYGLYLMGYVAVMAVTFMFMRNSIFIVNGIMQYVVLPSLALLFAMDAYNIITG